MAFCVKEEEAFKKTACGRSTGDQKGSKKCKKTEMQLPGFPCSKQKEAAVYGNKRVLTDRSGK